jgi:hypothetical protein
MVKKWAIAFGTAMNFIAVPALAEQGRIFKDPSGGVFVYGLQPHQAIQAARDEMTTKTIAANACGLLIIRDAVGEILVEQTLIDPAQLLVQMLPACTDGRLAESRSSSFRTSNGIIALLKSPKRWYTVSYLNQRRQRNLKANACGFIRLSGSSLGEKPLLPTLNGNIARFAIADLPTSEKLLCQRGQLYKSEDFPPPLATAMSEQTIDDRPQPPTIVVSQPAPWNLAPAPKGDGLNERIITFTIADPDTALNQLQITTNASSFSTFESARLAGFEGNRTLTIRPKNVSAIVPITIVVSDGMNTVQETISVELREYASTCKQANGNIVVSNALNQTNYTLRLFNSAGRNLLARTTRTDSSGKVTFTVSGYASGTLSLGTSLIRSFTATELPLCR